MLNKTLPKTLLSLLFALTFTATFAKSNKTNPPSNNANLSSLTTLWDLLSPTFNPNVTSYNITGNTTADGVIATPEDANATMQVRLNGGAYSVVTSGVASGSFNYNIGSNIVEVKVTAQDAVTTKTYTITYQRTGSNNAYLATLVLSAGSFISPFSPFYINYSTTISGAYHQINITATVLEVHATVKMVVNGAAAINVVSGTSNVVSLKVGLNIVDITVTAEDGVTVRTYTVSITRNAPIAPSIATFSPSKAKVGDTVNITGSQFNAIGNKNILYFGGTKTTAIAATKLASTDATASVLKAIVPSGATYAPITVLNTEDTLIAYSRKIFNPTYAPIKGSIAPSDFDAKIDINNNSDLFNMSTGDLDGDGKNDIVVVNKIPNSLGGNVSVYKNTSTPSNISFATAINLPVSGFTYHSKLADIDGDGKLDLVVACAGTFTTFAAVFLNTSTVGNISFAPNVNVTLNPCLPNRIEVADFNNDGKADIAYLDYYGYKVNIIKNTGSIGVVSFGASIAYTIPTTSYIHSLVAVDFDNDGKIDIISGNSSSSEFGFIRNTTTNGSISFATPVSYGSNAWRCLAIADINLDGQPDLVTFTSHRDLTVHLNNSTPGNIAFVGNKSFANVVNLPEHISIGDMDGDGKPDIIVANAGDTNIVVFRNTLSALGVMNFERMTLKTTSKSYYTAIADFDNDGRPDIAAVNYSDNANSFSIFRNISKPSDNAYLSNLTTDVGAINPSFDSTNLAYNITVKSTTTYITLTPTVSNALSTVQVKVNSGAYQAVANNTAFTHYLNFGNTIFTIKVTAQDTNYSKEYQLNVYQEPPPTITSFSPLMALAGTEITIVGNGFNTTANKNIVYFGAVKATPTSATATTLKVLAPSGATYAPITVIDTSIGLMGSSKQMFNLLHPIPKGSSMQTADFAARLGLAADGPSYVIVADIDGDGKPDVISGNTYNISVFRNNATGTAVSFAAKVDFAVSSNPFVACKVADIDGDGKLDIIAGGNDQKIVILLNTSTIGNISFAPKVAVVSDINQHSIAVGDIDGDGKPDIVALTVSAKTITTLTNRCTKGNLAFIIDRSLTIPKLYSSISLADLNGDDKLDMVVSGSTSTIYLYKNVSAPRLLISFEGPQTTQAAAYNFHAIADVDGDGKLDIIATNNGINSISVLRNISEPTSDSIKFEPKKDFTKGLSDSRIAVGDVDSDGKPDIVVSNQQNDNLTILRNVSIGTNINFVPLALATGVQPQGVAIGDINNDNRPDILVASYTGIVSIHRYLPVLSTNANLSALSLSTGGLTPAFSSANINYESGIGSGFTTVKVTAIRESVDASLSLYINGNYYTLYSGTASVPVNLLANDNFIDVIVTAQDGTTQKTYRTWLRNTLDIIGLSNSTAPPYMAYSLRKLSSRYTGAAIKVRRNNDNALLDIGFTSNGDLDTAALKTFVGGNSAYVVVFYDQSGKAYDLSQTTGNAYQPRIVNAGVIDRENGRPFIRFFGLDNTTTRNSLDLGFTATARTLVVAVNKFAAGGSGFLLGNSVTNFFWHSNAPTGLFTTFASSDIRNGQVWQNGVPLAPLSAVFNTKLGINTVKPLAPGASTGFDNIGNDRNIYHHISGGGGYAELLIYNNSISDFERTLIEKSDKNYYLSNDAYLTNLTTSAGALTPAIDTGTTAYSITTDSISTKVTATASNAFSKLELSLNSGAFVPLQSGVASAALNLATGDNTVDIRVTAQDGVTTKVYTITVTKSPQPAPTITSYSPASGRTGTVMTIDGTNFDNLTSLLVGNGTAIVLSNTSTQIVAMVIRNTGATGVVKVTTPGGIAKGAAPFEFTTTPSPNAQQGTKLSGLGLPNNSYQGYSVALSADGNTAIVGAPFYNGFNGTAIIYIKAGNTWLQQSSPLIVTGSVGTSFLGLSVAISADGNTALIGANGDNSNQGAAWVFTRSGSTWLQQGSKLVGTGNVGAAQQGNSVALSADGNTAAIGGFADNADQGATWIFTRSAGVWTQQGSKLVGTGNVGAARQGHCLSLSANGNNLLVGGYGDNTSQGAAWVFTRSAGVWTQQGSKLVGTNVTGFLALQGISVALSADARTAIIGGTSDNSNTGAAWIFTKSGSTWSQQTKLIATNNIGASQQGISVSISGDGNIAMIGGNYDNNNIGAAWIFTRNGTTWTQQNKLIGTGNKGQSEQGFAVALSADGTTGIVGGRKDNNSLGAAWAYKIASANLVNITLNNGASISPAFNKDTINYTANVNSSLPLVVIPEIEDASSTIEIKFNGGSYAAITSGAASSNFTLVTGQNTVTIKVTAADGITIKTYTITIFVANKLDKVGLLNNTPTVAYSLKKLSSTYIGNAIQIVRSSDNATLDIGFTANGDLDTTAIKSFVTNNDATVSKWYDQTGNGQHLTQATLINQPKLVTAGNIERENGRPFIRFYGVVGGNYNSLDLPNAIATNGFVMAVNKFAMGGDGFFLSHDNYYNWHSDMPNNLFNGTYASSSIINGKVWQNGIETASPAAAIWNNNLSINEVQPAQASVATEWNNIGRDRIYHYTTNGGGYAELIVFADTLTTTQKEVFEDSTKNYYLSNNTNLLDVSFSKGNLTPAFNTTVTSGYYATVLNAVANITITPTAQSNDALIEVSVNGAANVVVANAVASIPLALNLGLNTIDIKLTAQDGITTKTYSFNIIRQALVANTLDVVGLSNTTPALGAYSLRKLSNTYSGNAIQVVRSSDNATVDIGFTVNGDLDTSSLKSFVGASNGLVSKWYDQSGNLRDATQGIANRPIIVNSGVIERKNNYPYISFNGAAFLNTPFSLDRTIYPNVTVNAVYQNTDNSGTQALWGCDNSNWGRFQLLNYASIPSLGFGLSNGSWTTPNATNNTNKNIYTAVLNNGVVDASYAVVNGIVGSTFTENNGGAADSLAIGAISANGLFSFVGNASEFIFIPSALSTIDRQALEASQKAYYFSSNTNLLSISVSEGVLAPIFNKDSTNYIDTVGNLINSITITPTLEDEISTMQIRFNAGAYSIIANVTASTAMPLNIGSNTVDILVTAQTGITKTYSINVLRDCKTTSTTTVNICPNELPFSWNGNTYSTAGNYIVHLTNASGCDSAATLVLIVKNAVGSFGNALAFDGNDDYVITNDTVAINPDIFTMETWVYWNPANNTDVQFICGKGTEELEIHTGGGAGANGLRFIPKAGIYIDVMNVLPTKTWTHIAWTYNGITGETKIYANGILQTANVAITGTIAPQPLSVSPFIMGIRSGGYFPFSGKLDEFRIWNKVLTASEIQSRINSDLAGNETGLVTYYNFNQGVANGNNTAVDSLIENIGNTKNGVFNNIALTDTVSNFVTGYKFDIAPIILADSICITNYQQLTNTVLGGVWSNTNPLVASITPDGLLKPVYTPGVGVDTVKYTIIAGNGCASSVSKKVTYIIIQNALSIAVNSPVLVGDTIKFYSNVSNIIGFNWTGVNGFSSNLANPMIPNATLAHAGMYYFNVTTYCNQVFNLTYPVVVTVPATVAVSGRVISPLKKIIQRETISIKGTTTTDSMMPNTIGEYNFNVPPSNNYVVKAKKNNDITKANGINATDVLFTQRHILNTTKLNSAYKLIAADVNGDKLINATDVLRIKRLILGTDTTFPSATKGNRLWEFVDSAYIFPDTTNPFPFKDSISFTNLTSNKINQTFIGVKLGDVNYDWNPSVAKVAEVLPVELVANGEWQVVSGEVRIPVAVNNFKELVAMQYTLHFNNKNYEFVGIENNKLDIDFNSKQANENGNISFLWTDKKAIERSLEDGTEVFVLVLRSKVNSRQLTDLTLTNDLTEIAAWDKDYYQHNIILIQKAKIETQNSNDVWSVSPNPTSGEIKVSMVSKVNKTVSFELTDAQGKTILKQVVELQKGNNNFTMNLKKNGNISNGIYFLKAVGVESDSVKRIMVK